jgi:Double zinc ribbon
MPFVDPKIFHGELTPMDLAQALVAEFNRGTLRAQVVGGTDKLAVQIGTRPGAPSGGPTALTVTIQKVEDGVLVQAGEQEWLGTAASLGRTTIAALANPWSVLGRLDDLAQDVENIQLAERVWKVLDQTAHVLGTGQELSARLKRVTCEYCGTANPVGEAACIACGAPLGKGQPGTCPRCGFVVQANEIRCPNCSLDLSHRSAA